MEEEVPQGVKSLIDESAETEETKEEENKEETKEETSEATEGKASEEKTEEKEEEVKTPYKGKFKTFNSVEDLENSYSASFTEAQRLLAEIKAKDDEIAALKSAKTEETDEDEVDPEIAKIKANTDYLMDQQRKQSEREWNAFVGVHPEIESDPQVQDRLDTAIQFVSSRAQSKNKVISMAEALEEAWDEIVDPWLSKNVRKDEDDSAAKGAEDLAAKQMAAGEGPGGSTQISSDKKTLTDAEKRVAKTYGMTDEEYLKLKN